MNTARSSVEANPIGKLPYDRQLFVNRVTEIEIVKVKAQALSLDQPVRARALLFWGYKGSGHTWLLKHLEQVLPELRGVNAVYVDLEEYAESSSVDAAKQVISRVARRIRAENPGQILWYQNANEMSVAEMRDWLVNEVGQVLRETVLVLLLDHVFESRWEFLALLEEHILAPIIVQPHLLVVMAGRGQPYPWKRPELRLYTDEYHLSPFSQTHTTEQIRLQSPDVEKLVSNIYDLSNGYPYSNYLLAKSPQVPAGMQVVADSLLDHVPAEEREWIEALCILHGFDEERIPPLLTVYGNARAQNWTYTEVRMVRDRLLRTGLVRWKEEAGAWEVDSAIRPVLEKYLQQTKPEIWQRLHCAAYRLYLDWIERYAEERTRWQAEADYHARRLLESGSDPAKCS